jgi:C4-dicarboxylate-specific signal transduction histidine kinase
MVMMGLMTIGGLGLILVSAKNIVSRRRAEIELERANAELEERVARRTAELQVQTKALMESRMRERLREKEAEIAFQAGLVESAGPICTPPATP